MGTKVTNKQPNSRDCFICGMKNDHGLKTQFYETEDNELVALFTPCDHHQSFPNRVHGGISAAVLDELIGRALQIGNPDNWAVTVELNIKYLKPLPYGEQLKAVGRIDKDTRLLANGSGEIYNSAGEVAVSAKAKYMKMPVDKITTEKMEGDDWRVYNLPDDPDEI